jgi:tRNA threonylcarbamoyladenosine biosynthesis protein TsaB
MMPDSGANSNVSPAILAIDTSSSQGAVALYDGRTLAMRSWSADRSHTTTLLTEIHHILEAGARQIGELAAVGITVGPGPFTGLRAGFGVAKGFHLATGVPLVGIPTLEVAALPFATSGLPIAAAVGAGRGRLAWAWYEADGDRLRERRPARNGTVFELVAELRQISPSLVTGELQDEQVAEVAAIDGVRIPPQSLRFRHPGALADIAWRRWREGRIDDATALEPVYLSR